MPKTILQQNATTERRKFGRRSVTIYGRAYVSGRAPIYCEVLNLSDAGAFLQMQVPEWLPPRFILTYNDQPKRYGCEVRHTKSDGVGVSFFDPDHDTPVVSPEKTNWIGRLRRL
jgi:hypothetical protein